MKGELVMKLGQKLFLIFILTSALVISMTGYMTLKGTRNLFDRYLKENMYYRAQQWSEAFGEYYKAYDSWNGVEQLLYIGQRGRGRGFGIGTRWEHVILTDNDGYIVASSAGFEPDLRIELLEMNRGVPVTVDGKTVGFVFLETPQSAGVVSIEQQFISAVRRNMFISIAVSALMAVILGALSASKITKPLKQLSHAAYEMASGDLSVRVKVDGRDEIAETAQSFNNMAYNLQKSINLRNALTADVAHELRTPLTIIRGNLESIQEGILKPTPEIILSISDEIMRLSRLVSELQEVNQAESGNMILQITDVNPKELKDALSPIITEVKARGLNFDFEIDDKTLNIQMDKQRIVQVLLNLVSNAMFHTQSGGSIKVNIFSSGENAVFQVSDTGEGISKDDLPYIFDRFYRPDKSRNRKSGGSGLGLAIVKSIVELHNGKILAESTPGYGTTITFSLPLLYYRK